jgi:hypothetical protein
MYLMFKYSTIPNCSIFDFVMKVACIDILSRLVGILASTAQVVTERTTFLQKVAGSSPGQR